MAEWLGTIKGEAVSKENSRRQVPRVSKLGKVFMAPIKSADALAFKAAIERQVRPRKVLLEGPLIFYAKIYYTSMRRDLDPSLILDALQGRIYKNDRQIVEQHIQRGRCDKENPRCVIKIETTTWP